VKNIFKIVAALIIVLFPLLTSAQCAVCAAGAASTARTNGKYGAGINEGIIYLLIVTYLVFTLAAVYFFRHRIRYYLRTLSSRWRMFIASF
jgi:hypothetical protein